MTFRVGFLLIVLFAEDLYPQKPPERAVTTCAQEASAFSLKTNGDDTFIAYVSNGASELHARYNEDGKDGSAVFTIRREGKEEFGVSITDLGNPNGWITRTDNGQRFTITWSNSGGLGGWENRIFHFESGTAREDTSIEKLVEGDFGAKHNCQTRGDNFRSIRWVNDHSLLIAAEVYPTSDCGREMGFTQGYIVDVSKSIIEKRLSYRELLNLSGVCTQNPDKAH